MAKVKSVIGLEVDSREIRAVEITRSSGTYSILACGKAPLPEGTIEEGFIRDPDRFNVALTELLQSGGFKSLDVVVGINNENVIMRYATFPKVDDDKLRNMVLLQAQEFIPIPIQEMEIDYVVAGDGVNDEEQPITHVMLVAARRNMIEQYINILSASKLQVTDVDSSVLSQIRGLKAGLVGDEKFALLNMTDDLLNFIVIKGDEISMVRSITTPDRVVDSVNNIYKLEPNEETLAFDIEEIGAMLASETASSVSYYAMQNGDSPIEKIFFTTTADQSARLCDIIKDTVMEMPVIIPDFYSNYNFGLDRNVLNEFAGCIGLGIQALEV